MSDAEADRQPRWVTWLGALGAPTAFLVLWVAPLPIEAPAHRLAAIFGAVIVLWLTEVIPVAVTALLIAPALVLAEIAAPKDAFKHYADPLLFLFVGGFFIAESMSKHRLDRRIARWIVTSRLVRAIPSRVRLALMVATGLLSMWISNTAAAAIVVPILLGMVGPPRGNDRTARGALLGVAYMCSIGGLGSMVGSPPNLITVRFLRERGIDFGFVEWMAVGVPLAIVLGVAAWFVTRWLYPEEGTAADARADLFDDVPATIGRGEIVTALAFGIAMIGWTTPGFVAALAAALDGEAARTFAAVQDRLEILLEPGAVALCASAVLFAWPDGRGGRVLQWREAVRIDWGIILLFGGGIALGTALVSTGLAEVMSRGFVALTGIESVITLTILGCLFTIFVTEVCSNTATANMLVPIVIAIALEMGVSPILPALAVGFAASCAFMLPVGTGPNAIVYSTGRTPQAVMLRSGFWMNIASFALITIVVSALCWLYGWTELPY